MHPLTNLIVLFSISTIDTFNVHIVPKCKELYMLCPYIYMYIYICMYAYTRVCTCTDVYIIHIYVLCIYIIYTYIVYIHIYLYVYNQASPKLHRISGRGDLTRNQVF